MTKKFHECLPPGFQLEIIFESRECKCSCVIARLSTGEGKISLKGGMGSAEGLTEPQAFPVMLASIRS